jgi:septal ring factor EnvC (AmiA/AmiB activator)
VIKNKKENVMEAVSAKVKDKQLVKSNLNVLEEKVLRLIEMMKASKDEVMALRQKNKDLHAQLRALEGSLVSETKDLEELSQEKMVTKMVVDNLLHSIDALIEVREK